MLLAEPDTEVRLLIRAESPDGLAERLDALFRFWEIDRKDTARRDRVKGLRGDVTQHHLGLTDSECRSLVRDCTHIVHSAANVRMNLPLEAARDAAVGSARNILSLARECRSAGQLEKLEFVSTVGIGGRMARVPEKWVNAAREFHNTYEQSKAEAETWLREQVDRLDLPLTLHRPSMVVGDSRTGKVIHHQIFYYLCEFLSGKQTAGILPWFGNAVLDTIPVDYVARAIHWASSHEASRGRIFHLCSGPDKAMNVDWLITELRGILFSLGESLPRLRRVPAGLFRVALPAIKALGSRKVGKAINNLAIYLDYARDCQVFENESTNAMLAPDGIRVPAPEEYLARLMETWLVAKRD